MQRYFPFVLLGAVLAILAMRAGSTSNESFSGAPRAMMRESHMNPEEALRAATDLRAVRAVAVHYGTFDLSDEPLAEPPLRFKAAAKGSSLDDGAAWTLNIGETREF